VTDRRSELNDGLDPPDWIDGGSSTSARRAAPTQQGTVPPPRPPDPRFRPDRPPRTDPGGSPPGRRRPQPRHAPDELDDDVDEYERYVDDELDDELRDDHHDDDGDEEAHETDAGSLTRAGRRAAARAARADRMRRRRRSIAALAIVLALVLPFLLVGGWFVYQLNPPGGPGGAVRIDVEDGWGVSEIGDELASRGVIGSSLAFQLYARASGAGPFPEGRYRLREDLGVRDAVSRLEAGPVSVPVDDLALTLPPGLTLEQIAARVGELPGRSAETFLQLANSGVVRSRYQPPEVTSLEGLVFPDTYLIDEEEDETAILQRLVTQFDAMADAAGIANGAAAVGRTPYEAVVIASLIEREAGVEEDRPLISAVIANRLRDGELLQIDAANCYGKGGCANEPLTNADKESDSRYNTYRFPGLVPTPISSAGDASLRAAIAPAAVPYKFYVLADQSGRHAFAETFEEHERNVAAAREQGLL